MVRIRTLATFWKQCIVTSAHLPAALAASSSASRVSSAACRRHARSRCAARSMLSAAAGCGPCRPRPRPPPLPLSPLSLQRVALRV